MLLVHLDTVAENAFCWINRTCASGADSSASETTHTHAFLLCFSPWMSSLHRLSAHHHHHNINTSSFLPITRSHHQHHQCVHSHTFAFAHNPSLHAVSIWVWRFLQRNVGLARKIPAGLRLSSVFSLGNLVHLLVCSVFCSNSVSSALRWPLNALLCSRTFGFLAGLRLRLAIFHLVTSSISIFCSALVSSLQSERARTIFPKM